MRSPFNPGGANQLLPADPGIMWQFALGVMQQQVAMGLLPAELGALLPVLGALSPTANDIGVVLLNASTGVESPLSSTTVPTLPGIQETYTETFEVGWQGILANKFRISADVYHTKVNDFISPLLIQNPLLKLNGDDIDAFIRGPIVGAITQQLIGMGVPAEIAQQTAQAQAAVLAPQIAGGIAQVPLGVAATPEIASQGADIIVSYRNVGDVSYWGADLGFSWFLDDKFTLSGTYSHVEKDWFPIDDGEPIALNAPKDKGTLGLAFRNPKTGFNAEARVRWSAEFPAESAGYVGTKCLEDHEGGLFEEDCVEAATLVDVNLGYRIPNTPATVQLAVTNLFDHDYRSFVGVPFIGRFAMVRLKYDVF
jgi:iron complex outermembrane receptor protein